MDNAESVRIQRILDEEIRGRFPEGLIDEVKLLQYGDDPAVEPGKHMLRIIVAAGGDEEGRTRIAREFEGSFREQMDQIRRDLGGKLPDVGRVEIRIGDDQHGPRFFMASPGHVLEARALGGGDLTPVMARLGPVDLETLDTLITAGIASNRAEAVRWALARIRERPAYAQLRAKAAEIEELKTLF